MYIGLKKRRREGKQEGYLCHCFSIYIAIIPITSIQTNGELMYPNPTANKQTPKWIYTIGPFPTSHSVISATNSLSKYL